MLRLTSPLRRLTVSRAPTPGGARRFSQPTRPTKPDADALKTPAVTPLSSLSTFAATDADALTPLTSLTSSLPGGGGDGGRHGGPPLDIEMMTSFVRSELGVHSVLQPRFDDRLGLNDSGVSPDSALKLLQLFDDHGRLLSFAEALRQDALGLTGSLGRSVRLDVPFHQYQITSQMHDVTPHADRWLIASPSSVKMKNLVACFPPGGKLDGVATLGRSGIVQPSHFRDVDLGDITASLCMMTTTKWHALDGYLMWMLLHYRASRQFCYFAYGSGQHRVRAVDELNPILGGAMMSTMAKRLAVALNQQFTPDGKSAKEIRDFIRKHDPELARRCELLALLDLTAVPIAAYRELMGGNTVAKPETE